MFIGLIYIVIPTILIGILAFKSQPNKLGWLLSLLLTGLAICFIWITARWEIISIYSKYLFPLLYVIACIYSYRKISSSPKKVKKIALYLNVGLHFFLIFFFTVMNFLALRGYRTPENTIDLASPLRIDNFIILHGGSRPMINAHFHVNPQNYAIDIVGLNKWGMRASSIGGGTNLNDYVIFGQSVYSPCNGKVLVVVDEFDDLTPPLTDSKNIAGNHVLIDFNGNEVLLAHLKKGSIKVKMGDVVDTNTIIGHVGNTGNTSEPHLHMHVETGGEPNKILNGKAVPFTINKRFLIRGDVIN